MNQKQHAGHTHRHNETCGHAAIRHGDHVDYLHDGHLHREDKGNVYECRIAEDATNPSRCTSGHDCAEHEGGHAHGPGCGHQAIPHGDHTDYLVEGHLHHSHSGHCDDHGPVSTR